ncbi:MAG: flagellar basal-body rod protein FlgF [Spirochaetes bacterium]|nr:flagellar basal-body rod protein FlgF [Spirochaetota bacterium]
MIRGIYTGASGMLAQQARMDNVANNLANVDTNAYKKDTTIFKSFPDMIIRRIDNDGVGLIPLGSYDSMPYVGKLPTGVEVNEVFKQFEQGALMKTENNFDLALEGKGFFTVLTEKGEMYTRNGSFTINDEGVLMTHNGNPVLGENGIIRIQQNNFMIREDGQIVVNADEYGNPVNTVVGMNENEWKNQIVLDKLKIVDFDQDRYLEKNGDSFYRENELSGPPLPPDKVKVYQGFLEKSNVNVVREMVDMIDVQRSYEANQKTITAADSTLGKLINEVAK